MTKSEFNEIVANEMMDAGQRIKDSVAAAYALEKPNDIGNLIAACMTESVRAVFFSLEKSGFISFE